MTQDKPPSSLDELFFESDTPPLLLRRRVLIALVLGFAALVVLYLWVSQTFDLSLEINAEPFRNWIDDMGIWGPVAFVVILGVSVLFAPIPNAPIFFAAGLAWGPILGTAYSLAGLLLGSAAAFWVARRMGRKWLPRLVGRKAAQRIDSLADSMGGQVVFWARMLPVVNFDWISYLAGLTGIRFGSYFSWSALGMLLPTFVAVGAGDGIGRDFRITLFYGGLWILGILFSAGYFWWHRRRARQRRREDNIAMTAETDEKETVNIGVK